MKRNIGLKLCYVGTNYSGWQIQKGVRTIQGEVKKAIHKITMEDVLPHGASRTDAGVHAIGQIANFFTTSEIPAERFKFALNSVLPDDIKVLKSWEAPEDFDARKTPNEKTYKYIIINSEPIPFLRNLALFVKNELDIQAMIKSAEFLKEKELDFSTFTPEKEKSTRRFILESKLIHKGKLIIYSIKAKSFLRYMVRNIVGALLMVGLKKMTQEEFVDLFDGKGKVLFTAPPCGLYLAQIKYKKEIIKKS